MQESDNTEQRPRPEPETMIEEKRSAGHAALQAVETIATGAEWTLGALAVTGAAMKAGVLGSKENDSNESDSTPDPGDQG